MKYLIIILLLLSACTHLDLSAGLVPPHNEPILGDRIARYKAEIEAGAEWKRLTLDLDTKLWGLNQWQRNIGSGWDAWENTEWGGLDGYRWETNAKLGFRIYKGFGLVWESQRNRYIDYTPKNFPDKYWNIVGIRWKIK